MQNQDDDDYSSQFQWFLYKEYVICKDTPAVCCTKHFYIERNQYKHQTKHFVHKIRKTLEKLCWLVVTDHSPSDPTQFISQTVDKDHHGPSIEWWTFSALQLSQNGHILIVCALGTTHTALLGIIHKRYHPKDIWSVVAL